MDYIGAKTYIKRTEQSQEGIEASGASTASVFQRPGKGLKKNPVCRGESYVLTFKRAVFNTVKASGNMCFEEVDCSLKQELAEGNSSCSLLN